MKEEDSNNKAAIELLKTECTSKAATLEASDKANADALAALKTEYEAKVDALLSKHEQSFGECFDCEYCDTDNSKAEHNISIGSGNSSLTNAAKHFNYVKED